MEECSSRLKGWRWRLRGCSLRLRCSLGLRGCRWRLRGCTLGLRGVVEVEGAEVEGVVRD